MPPKYKIRQPNHWRLALDCKHDVTLTLPEIEAKKVEARLNASTGRHDDFIICPKCSADRPRPGDFCTQSHIHRVVLATPMYSSSSSSYQPSQQQQQPQQQQENPKP